ncbi:hypothetical protein AZ14_2690, partial [Bordetella bronchiseptica 980]
MSSGRSSRPAPPGRRGRVVRGGMVEVLVVAISMSMRSAAMKRTLMELRHSAAIHAR